MKAFSINIRFDLPQAGAIPIAATDKEEATKKAHLLFQNCRNVEVLDVVEVPLSALLANMDASDFAEEAEIITEEKVN